VAAIAAFINVGADKAIASIATVTSTVETAQRVGASSINMTVVSTKGTFVDVGTGLAITFVTASTCTGKVTLGIKATGIDIAVVCKTGAFVNVVTHDCCSFIFVPSIGASTFVTAVQVNAVVVKGTNVGTCSAFVDVDTFRDGAIILDISSMDIVSFVSVFTSAVVEDFVIVAVSIGMTLVTSRSAFVNVANVFYHFCHYSRHWVRHSTVSHSDRKKKILTNFFDSII
jgi:hypothetical protein